MKRKMIARLGRSLLYTPAVVAMVLIAGCSFGRVGFIEIVTDNSKHDVNRDVYGYVKGDPVEIHVWGEGACTLARLNFGDGVVIERNIDFGKAGATTPWVVQHSYQGWAGPKTITAEGITNCGGKATAPIRIFMPSDTLGSYGENFLLAYAPGPRVCDAVPVVPPLRPNTRVSISDDSGPLGRINFGCIGCIFTADGEPNSHAPSSFPFPGLRKFSLVLRVGTQVEQGGRNVSFTTNQGGPLEVCVNDDILWDNSGGWGIVIDVDESRAP